MQVDSDDEETVVALGERLRHDVDNDGSYLGYFVGGSWRKFAGSFAVPAGAQVGTLRVYVDVPERMLVGLTDVRADGVLRPAT